VIGNTELAAPDVVALAEALGCSLVTADRRLSRAPGLGVPLITV
jgi:predicted nucleic acid-binding protein